MPVIGRPEFGRPEMCGTEIAQPAESGDRPTPLSADAMTSSDDDFRSRDRKRFRSPAEAASARESTARRRATLEEDSDDEVDGLHDSPAVHESRVCRPHRRRDSRRALLPCRVGPATPRSAIGDVIVPLPVDLEKTSNSSQLRCTLTQPDAQDTRIRKTGSWALSDKQDLNAGNSRVTECRRKRRQDKFIKFIVKGKGKVFPYSLPSVGPGADPGVQAVSPQVT